MAKKKPVRKSRERKALVLARVRFYALAFFVFSMPLFILPGNTEYGYTKSIYTLAFVSLLLILWGAEALLRRRVEVELSWLSPIIPALLLTTLVSLNAGAPAGVVLQSATLLLYFGFLYLLVANTAQEDHEVVLLLSALLASGALTGLYGLLQYLGVMRGGPGTGLDALISTMGNRNYLGGFLSYLFFPAGVLLFRLKRPWARALALVGLGFVLAMALFVQQTGVRVGLIAAALFVGFGLGLWAPGGTRWPWWAAAGGIALGVLGAVLGWVGVVAGLLVGVAGAGLWALGRAIHRFRWAWIPALAVALLGLFLVIPPTTPIPGVREVWEENSGRIRAWDWWVGYEMWRDHPLFGIGLGAYKLNFVPYKADFLATPRGADYRFHIARAAQAHNEYVQVTAELGAVGFLVVLTGIGLIAYFGLRRIAAQRERERRMELLLLGAGVLACLVHAAVSFPWHLPSSGLAFVVALGLAFSPRYGPVGGLRAHLRGLKLKGVVAGLTVLGIGVSTVAVRDLIADRYLWVGRNALEGGNASLALDSLERAVALDFCPRISLYYLGLAQFEVGDLPAAQATLRACLPRFRPEALYLNLAQVDVELEDYEEARALLTELLTTHPARDAELRARYLLAKVDLAEGNHPEAELKLRKLLDIDRTYELAWILLGDIARGTYRYPEAREHYQQALQVIESKTRGLQKRLEQPLDSRERNEIERELGRLGRAQEAVEQVLAKLP